MPNTTDRGPAYGFGVRGPSSLATNRDSPGPGEALKLHFQGACAANPSMLTMTVLLGNAQVLMGQEAQSRAMPIPLEYALEAPLHGPPRPAQELMAPRRRLVMQRPTALEQPLVLRCLLQ